MIVMKRLILGLVVGIIIIAGNNIFSAEFTADVVITKADVCDTLKIYVNGYTYRLEKFEEDSHTVMFRKHGSTYVLDHRKGGSTYVLDHDNKQYKELWSPDEDKVNPVAAWENLSYQMRGRLVGQDTISGYDCEIFGYSYLDDDKVIFKRWFAENLQFIIKQVLFEDDSKSVMELINIIEKPVDKTLFEVPEEYKEKEVSSDK